MTDKPKIDIEEQLAFARKLLREAEAEAAFRRGLVHALEQLHKGEPVILRQEQSPPAQDDRK